MDLKIVNKMSILIRKMMMKFMMDLNHHSKYHVLRKKVMLDQDVQKVYLQMICG